MSSETNDESSKKLVDKIGQFVTIPYSFIHQSKELSFHACWLFVVLRYYTNGESGEAFPSYETMRKLTGMRREMIAKSIHELESRGWLTKKKRFGNSNRYTLIIPPPSANRKQDVTVSDVSENIEEVRRRSDDLWRRVPPYGIRQAEL